MAIVGIPNGNVLVRLDKTVAPEQGQRVLAKLKWVQPKKREERIKEDRIKGNVPNVRISERCRRVRQGKVNK